MLSTIFHHNIFLSLFLSVMVLFGCGQQQSQKRSSDETASSTTLTQLDGEKNQLQYSNSPYLLQHADNPVNWYPWGEEAFQKARKENKPIFLSIGYSTCYWCHVMERKVFMDEQIAAKMNTYFVSIKVDREERPDVDRVYMSAVRAMTGGGGWPMSVFLTPELMPFFGATYIPPEGRGGRPGFSQLADQLNNAWRNNRAQVISQAEKVTEHIKTTASPQLEPQEVSSNVMANAFESYSNRFDSIYGGFGPAPKFPRPSNFDFLLRYYQDTGKSDALELVEFTLQKMAKGGVYDHIGEGFHRYSTDNQWRVPHFEKMLYDQAQLANSYLKAYKITGKEEYANVAGNIFGFVDRRFYHSEGGFYSALNAESPPPENPDGEEEEGAFYLWTKAQIEEALPAKQARIFNYRYGVEADGNALKDPHNVFTGKNILYKKNSLTETAKKYNLTPDQTKGLLQKAEQKLFEIRLQRPNPFLDDKIVLSWNSLMISAYANGYAILGEKSYLEHAEKSFLFLMENMYHAESGTFKRRYRAGEARFDAGLADYAYLVQGVLDLYTATDNAKYLEYARKFTDKQIDLFYDERNSAFYDTGMEGKNLLMRTKEFYDGARPSGNSVAVNNLVRLAKLTKNNEYAEIADETIKYFGKYLDQQPSAMPQMLQGLSMHLNSGYRAATNPSKQ